MAVIMVVEDERIVAEDIQNRLQQMGYRVSAVVSSGEEAVERAAKDTPDLVLMDIVLKGDMDGIEAADHISSLLSIPVVYLTAHTDEKRLQRAKVTEPYGYLLKPFEDRELHTTLETALYKHEMEKKLKESEQWLSTTLKSIGDGVITTDTKGLVTFMNPVAELLTGWTHTEAVGKTLEDVFCILNEITRERCENPFEKIMETGNIVGLANNTVLVSKDGTERVIADSGAPIRDNDYGIVGTVLVFRDVTEKRKMEDNILKLKTEKMESLSILAGGIAHVLTAILGNISVAKLHIDREDEAYRILTEAEKASLKAKNLTQQLLTFSKEGVLVKNPTSIGELLKDTCEFALRGSNVRCHVYLSDALWDVTVDEGQISQVISNLIINAEQAMPDGGVITVKAENVTKTQGDKIPVKRGDYVCITVQDEGIGILKDHLQKVFEPYFTTKQKGSGLGLATSYSIVKNHDGYMMVESEVGVGTTFSVWLPASQTGAVEKREGKVIKGTERILVMDDDETVLNVANEVLNNLGYKAEFTRDGKEAVEQYKRALREGIPFDTVIMDLTVRGGTGAKEALEKLLEIDPSVKAIVCSGYSNHPVVVNFEKYGFAGAVTKPYSIEELSVTLYDVIHQ
jgi:PAS domain S-box-containing protein